MRLLLSFCLSLVLAPSAFTQSTAPVPPKVIRWLSPDLPKDCCNNYMTNGRLMTGYQDANLEYAVMLIHNQDDKYDLAFIYFQNKSDRPFTVNPKDFTFAVTSPKQVVLSSLDPDNVIKEIEKRGSGGRAFRTFLVAFARQYSSIQLDESGTFGVTSDRGRTARGTYSGTTTGSVSVPDYEAQQRVRESNAKEKAKNAEQAEKMNVFALRANTLFKNDIYGGMVYFKKNKDWSGAVLSFEINGIVYEVPYGDERVPPSK
jgi:hypothetical protein